MSTGTLVKIEPTGTITRIRCESKAGPTHVELQDAVGGYYAKIGVVYEGKKRVGHIDEDAKMKAPARRPPLNPLATRMVQEYYADGGMTVDILGNLVVWIPDEKPAAKESFTLSRRNHVQGE